MSQPAKRFKIAIPSDNLAELNSYRNEIRRLNASRMEEVEYLIEDEESDMKVFVQNEIRESENRINQRLDRIERKLNLVMEKLGVEEEVEEILEEEEEENRQYIDEVDEEQVIEYIQDPDEPPHTIADDDTQIFPITDEETFDQFMLKLREDTYRNNLVEARWELTKNVGTRSFNVAVKDFMLMHFQLAVCIKYSVSGYGSRGTKKKKLDAKTLVRYTYDCFNKLRPEAHSYQEVTKAITQFWGRAHDNFVKMTERIVKQETNVKGEKF